ncbi:MAG: hypothetical protein ABIP14_07480 [Blastocatellia bacterium]
MFSGKQIPGAMPFVRDVSHDQSVIELHASWREFLLIGEKA